jgi:predicted nuclease of predicted toxin-antitoxin system
VKLLLDHCIDRRLAGILTSHDMQTSAELGWEQLRNGELLARAAQHGFDAVVTTDANVRHQQNLQTLPISVIVLRAMSNRLADLLPLVPQIESALESLTHRPRIVEIWALRSD